MAFGRHWEVIGSFLVNSFDWRLITFHAPRTRVCRPNSQIPFHYTQYHRRYDHSKLLWLLGRHWEINFLTREFQALKICMHLEYIDATSVLRKLSNWWRIERDIALLNFAKMKVTKITWPQSHMKTTIMHGCIGESNGPKLKIPRKRPTFVP